MTHEKEPVLRDADDEPDDTAAEVPDAKEGRVPEPDHNHEEEG